MFENIIKRMSIDDKISFLSGSDAWHTEEFLKYGIPAMMMADGPHGIRKQSEKTEPGINLDSEAATCFPTATVLATTWNRDLVKRVGQAIGLEAKAANVNLVLGPGVNIKRNPLCGRNFEYYSEDPYLAGELASEWIKGVKMNGVEACVKHFAGNNQENCRMTSNSMIDERTLREIYLAAFEKVVKESKPGAVMCSYNKLNGTYLSDNKRMLTDILRDEWGFDGMVVSDWTATHDRVESLKAGMDLEMPSSNGGYDKMIRKALLLKKLDIKTIDKAIERILKLVYDSELIKKDKKNQINKEKMFAEHNEIALIAAQEGGVLLQNKNHILPINVDEEVLVVGAMAKKTRFQGAGSSAIKAQKITSILDALEEKGLPYRYEQGYEMENVLNDKLKQAASAAAISARKVIVVLGLTDAYDSEGFDRKHMRLPGNQIELLKAITKVNKNIVVVTVGGGAVEMRWKKYVSGILQMQLAGQAVGMACVNLLYGYENPSGRLAESYPLKYEDVPSSEIFNKCPKQAEYQEGIYVGYRYYEKANVNVCFPFGYGLSYTRFAYSGLQVQKEGDDVVVSFAIQNVGDYDGYEVAQVYVADKTNGVHRPIKELKGFSKVYLRAGESKNIEIVLDERAFSYYDVKEKKWIVQNGRYEILVGASSEDIFLIQSINKIGVWTSKDMSSRWYYEPIGKPTTRIFETIYGEKIEPYVPETKGTFTIYNTLADMKGTSKLVNALIGLVEQTMAKGNGGKVDYSNPAFRMLVETAMQTPLANLRLSLGYKISQSVIEDIVSIANGKGIVRSRLMKLTDK